MFPNWLHSQQWNTTTQGSYSAFSLNDAIDTSPSGKFPILNDYVNVSISTPQDFMENPNPIKKIIIKEKIYNLLFVAVGATARTHNL